MSDKPVTDPIIDLFLADFGFTSPETKDISIDVNGRPWTFTMSQVADHDSNIWITTHAALFTSRSADTILSAELANNLELSLVALALGTRAVNGLPLYVFVQKMDSRVFSEEEMQQASKATNQLFPEAPIHRRAAAMWLDRLRKMDRGIIDAMSSRFESAFTDKSVATSYSFVCEDSDGCGYTYTTTSEEVGVVAAGINSTDKPPGSVFCPRCGSRSLPKAGLRLEDRGSPLALRFGRQWKPTAV